MVAELAANGKPHPPAEVHREHRRRERIEHNKLRRKKARLQLYYHFELLDALFLFRHTQKEPTRLYMRSMGNMNQKLG